MMNVIKPLLHEHHLLFDIYNEQEASCCDKCHEQIDDHDSAFNCEICNFWLHRSCAQQQLPPKISHPLHPHQLTLFCPDPPYPPEYHRLSICHKCFYLTRGCIYECSESSSCNFMLDLICACSTFLTNDIDQTPESRIRSSKQIVHFSHPHELHLFNYRKVAKDDYTCGWCEKLLLSGIFYGCLDSYCKEVFFHESCLINMPTSISKHQFHPSHPLHLQPLLTWYEGTNFIRCNVCTDIFGDHLCAYTCKKCKFRLHIGCATIQPSIKLELHQHSLTYFQTESWRIQWWRALHQCNICNKKLVGHRPYDQIAFYRCVQCDFNLHFGCTQIPSSTKHKYHRHELKLVDSFIEDDSNEYFCDVCEKERKPKHRVYCCKTCKYVAHIRCALDKGILDAEYNCWYSTSNLVDGKVTIGRAMERDLTKQRNAKSSTHLAQIDHYDHEHLLSYYEVFEQNNNVVCKACCLKISDQAYACKSCEYYLHKGCTQLPYELLQPLHPQHSLKLFTFYPEGSELLPCYECKTCSGQGFIYLCSTCGFLLHVKCTYSSSTMPKYDQIQRQRLKKIESQPPSEICLFNQDHKLDIVNYGSDLQLYNRCGFCHLYLTGPSYECLSCQYRLHAGCLWFPREMQLQFHPQHTVHACVPIFGRCLLCKYRIFEYQISYSCMQCDLHLHVDCARILKRVVKSESHMHNVHYVGREPIITLSTPIYNFFGIRCVQCQMFHDGSEPVYICMECNTWLHFTCAQILQSIKSKYHIHPLTLEQSLTEDGSGEYYCDICEEERYSKDHIYYCIECQGSFVAHIDCTLTSVEEIVKTEEPSSSESKNKVSSTYESNKSAARRSDKED